MVASPNPALPEDNAPETLPGPILVVSCDHNGRSAIKLQLEQAGYPVQEAASATEALKTVSQHPPKLILLDTDIAGMDGYALTRHLREEVNLAAVPIIHMVDIGAIALRGQSLESGANDFVLKPPLKTELLNRVHTLLELQRSREELQVERAKTELIYISSRELSAELDLNVLLSRVLELVRTSIGALGGSVILLDEQGHPYRHIFSHRGEVTSVSDKVWDKVVQDGLAGWVIRQRQGTIVQQAWQDPRWIVGGYQLIETRSAMAVPLIPEGRVVGVLTLTHEKSAYFTPAHLDLVLSIAYQAAVVIDKAYAYHKAKLRARQLRLINEVSRQISSILEPEQLLQSVARLACQAFDYDYVQVALIAGVELILQSWDCERQQRLRNTSERLSLYDQGVIPWVARQGQPLLVPDVQLEPRYRLVEERPAADSELAVPLKAGDEVLGVLDIQCSYPNQLTEADVPIVEILAAQVSIVLSNAHLFAAIKHERSQLAAILTGTNEAIIATNEKQHVTLLNPAAERVFGVSFNESVGRPLEEVLPYAAIARAFEQIRQKTDPNTPNELTLPDGRTFSINVSSITNPDGATRWVAVMQDISYLKELDRMKNDFVSTVSHDLRTPLTSIHGYAELLLETTDGLNRSFAEQIKTIAWQMSQLVQNLLDLGKIEAGVEIVRRPCAMGQLVEEAVDAVMLQAHQGGIALETKIPQAPCIVEGDPRRLRQVLDNLLSNALKYTPAGGQVSIRLGEQEGHVWVEVQDSGMGIPEEAIPHLYEKFYRVPSPDADEIPGTGLGLTIVKAIVEQHSGKLSVESKLGQGSRFSFSLPPGKRPPVRQQPVQTALDPSRTASQEG